ncbi:MAG: hypothetical protein H0Z35_12460 [Thermoanaerobacteraceae bacterium]|nr:hypothetical protein [Thermoanaerobacteraceae bacterium]
MFKEGERVIIIQRKQDGRRGSRDLKIKGRIVQDCDKFIVVDRGKYRETFLKQDILTGFVRLESAS